eukprot:gene1202-biopygen971
MDVEGLSSSSCSQYAASVVVQLAETQVKQRIPAVPQPSLVSQRRTWIAPAHTKRGLSNDMQVRHATAHASRPTEYLWAPRTARLSTWHDKSQAAETWLPKNRKLVSKHWPAFELGKLLE